MRAFAALGRLAPAISSSWLRRRVGLFAAAAAAAAEYATVAAAITPLRVLGNLGAIIVILLYGEAGVVAADSGLLQAEGQPVHKVADGGAELLAGDADTAWRGSMGLRPVWLRRRALKWYRSDLHNYQRSYDRLLVPVANGAWRVSSHDLFS